MIQIPVCGCGQLECSEADVVQSLVIDAECLVRILHQLVNRKGGIVRFYNGVRHLNNIEKHK